MKMHVNESEYIAIIAIIISVISLVATCISSSKQYRLSEVSMKMSKQPLFILKIEDTRVGSVFNENGRRQLYIYYSLKNIGDAPAISVYCCCYFELQHTTTEQNMKKVPIDYYPEYFHAIEVDKEEYFSLQFKTEQINYLVNDLHKEYEMNMERVRTAPSKEPYEGPILVTEIFFSNTVGQWFRYTNRIGIGLLQEINDEVIELQSSKPKHDYSDGCYTDEDRIYWTRYHELMQRLDRVPPLKIKKESKYQLQFINPQFYNSILTPLEQDCVKAELSQYDMRDEMKKSFEKDGSN